MRFYSLFGKKNIHFLAITTFFVVSLHPNLKLIDVFFAYF